jgi:hypothetical protein
MRRPAHEDGEGTVPSIGDRVERRRAGVTIHGTVQYADRIQILVKWDDGSSSSLRVGRSQIRILKRRGRA